MGDAKDFFVARAVGIANECNGAVLAIPFKGESPHRPAQAGDGQNVIKRCFHLRAELIDGDGVINTGRLFGRNLC